MRSTHANKLSQNLVELESQPIQPLAQNAIRRLSLIVCIGPRVDERAHRLKPRGITDRNFQKLRRGPPLDTKNTNPIASVVLQADRREIGDAIRRDVLMRIAHLVD